MRRQLSRARSVNAFRELRRQTRLAKEEFAHRLGVLRPMGLASCSDISGLTHEHPTAKPHSPIAPACSAVFRAWIAALDDYEQAPG